MQTRYSSKFVGEPSTKPTSTIPKCRNRRRSIQRVEPFSLVETPVVTIADQHTMAELLRAPTEGYVEAIVVPPIPAEHFELKHSLINLVTSKRFFGFEKEDPHAHIGYFNKITYTSKYKYMPESSIKLMFFPFSIDGPARIWLDKEPSEEFFSLGYDLFPSLCNQFFPWTVLRNLHQAWPTSRFYQIASTGYLINGLLYNSQLSRFFNFATRWQFATPSDLEKFKKTNEASRQAMRNHISNLKSELRSEMQSTMQNQNNAFKNELTNDIKNMMASFFQINTASSSSSGSLPSNTIANPKG
ncbi:hypothetical protein Tco_1533986 [Tanacetum coccineum]